jgi:hypothetical protein
MKNVTKYSGSYGDTFGDCGVDSSGSRYGSVAALVNTVMNVQVP